VIVDRRPRTKALGIGFRLALGKVPQCVRPKDQLQIRLQNPPMRNTRLIGQFEHGFVIARRLMKLQFSNRPLSKLGGKIQMDNRLYSSMD
jgi:hypothetical protein